VHPLCSIGLNYSGRGYICQLLWRLASAPRTPSGFGGHVGVGGWFSHLADLPRRGGVWLLPGIVDGVAPRASCFGAALCCSPFRTCVWCWAPCVAGTGVQSPWIPSSLFFGSSLRPAPSPRARSTLRATRTLCRVPPQIRFFLVRRAYRTLLEFKPIKTVFLLESRGGEQHPEFRKGWRVRLPLPLGLRGDCRAAVASGSGEASVMAKCRVDTVHPLNLKNSQK
jgi:hypothetical protein